MNDQPSSTSLTTSRWLAAFMVLAALGSGFLIVDLLRTSNPEYVLQFDGSDIPPAYMLALVIVFCILFVVRVLMKKGVNIFAVTIASLFSLILALVAVIAMQNYFLMSIILFDSSAAPIPTVLALLGIIALLWPHKARRL